MTSVEAMTHAINATNMNQEAQAQAQGKGKGGGSSGSSSLSPTTPLKKISAPAPAPAPKDPSPGVIKEIVKAIQVDEKAERRKKIKKYLKNPCLGKYLEGIQEPDEKASLDVVKAVHEDILSRFKEQHKRNMVLNAFGMGLKIGEDVMVKFLQREEKFGMAQMLMANKDELFNPELEEIIIELSDSWVPGPEARLAMKLAQIVMQFDNRMIPGGPSVPRESSNLPEGEGVPPSSSKKNVGNSQKTDPAKQKDFPPKPTEKPSVKPTG